MADVRSLIGTPTAADFAGAAGTPVVVDRTTAAPKLYALDAAGAVTQLGGKVDAASGIAGLNAASRITKGVLTTDDVIVNAPTKGLVLKDTQATPHYWRVTVSTLGVLVVSDIGTSAP